VNDAANDEKCAGTIGMLESGGMRMKGQLQTGSGRKVMTDETKELMSNSESAKLKSPICIGQFGNQKL
jgi:hypothetical protein